MIKVPVLHKPTTSRIYLISILAHCLLCVNLDLNLNLVRHATDWPPAVGTRLASTRSSTALGPWPPPADSGNQAPDRSTCPFTVSAKPREFGDFFGAQAELA